MDYTFILFVLYIIGYIFTSYYQFKKINALEKENSSLKELIRSIEKYIGMIDMSKLKDYADLREEKAVLEMSNKVEREFIPKIREMTESFQKSNGEYKKAYKGAMIMLGWILTNFDPEARLKLLSIFKEQEGFEYLEQLVTNLNDKKQS